MVSVDVPVVPASTTTGFEPNVATADTGSVELVIVRAAVKGARPLKVTVTP